jgi:uncharacterized protein (DUF2141 family)
VLYKNSNAFAKNHLLCKDLYKYSIYLFLIVLCASCAQITPLTGGKKDTTPPKAVKYVPEKASVNVNPKTIEITFDEYIVLKDVSNQFIITPQMKEMPEIQASGKKLKISFSETLLPNTTYKLSFGNAIVDLHESNALPSFDYVFSTGNYIDSLKLRGNIEGCFDKKASSGFLVSLYDLNTNDSVIYKEKPLYISKTNSAGNFEFNYLPNKSFKMVAIQDKNKNLFYDGSEEEIAFIQNPVLSGDTSDVKLRSFKEIPNKSFIKKQVVSEPGKVIAIYNKAQENIKEVIANDLVSYSLNRGMDSLSIFHSSGSDSLMVQIIYNQAKTDTLLFNIKRSVKSKEKPLKFNVACNCNGELAYFNNPILKFNYPVKEYDIDLKQMVLFELKDSVKTKKEFKLEAINKAFTNYKILTELKTDTKYELNVYKNAFKNSTGRTNDTTVFKYNTNSSKQYASLDLKIIVPKKDTYIIQLIDDKNFIVQEQTTSFSLASSAEKIIRFERLTAGNYTVRAVIDSNNNKKFDTGNYLLKQQPEEIFMSTSPIKILSGWEIEQEWLLK